MKERNILKTMQGLIEIENELQVILIDGKRKIQEYREEVEVAKQNEIEANRKVIKAKQGDNPKAYNTAIEDKRIASNISEYYQEKIEQIEKEPYITEEEYNNYTKLIKDEMNEINKEATERVKIILQDLKLIADEVSPSLTKTNELLSILQNKIYKNSYEKQLIDAKKNKTPLNSEKLINEYKDYSLIHTLNKLINTILSQEIMSK